MNATFRRVRRDRDEEAHAAYSHVPVERAALVVQGLAGATNTLLASAQSTEVLDGARHILGVQLKDHAACGLAADGDVEEHAGVGHLDKNCTTKGECAKHAAGRLLKVVVVSARRTGKVYLVIA